jgi:hypothetical protein
MQPPQQQQPLSLSSTQPYYPNTTREPCTLDEHCRYPLLCYKNTQNSTTTEYYCSCSSWWSLTGPNCNLPTISTYLQLIDNIALAIFALLFTLLATSDVIFTYSTSRKLPMSRQRQRYVHSFTTFSTISSSIGCILLFAGAVLDIRMYETLCMDMSYHPGTRTRCGMRLAAYFLNGAFICCVVSMILIAVAWDKLSLRARFSPHEPLPGGMNSSPPRVAAAGGVGSNAGTDRYSSRKYLGTIILVISSGIILVTIMLEINSFSTIVLYGIYLLVTFISTNIYYFKQYCNVHHSLGYIVNNLEIQQGMGGTTVGVILVRELNRLQFETGFVVFGNLVTLGGALPFFIYHATNQSTDLGRDAYDTGRSIMPFLGTDLIAVGLLISMAACILYNSNPKHSQYSQLLRCLRFDKMSFVAFRSMTGSHNNNNNANNQNKESPRNIGVYHPELIMVKEDQQKNQIEPVPTHRGLQAKNPQFHPSTQATAIQSTLGVSSLVSNVSVNDDARLLGYGDGFDKNQSEVEWVTRDG